MGSVTKIYSRSADGPGYCIPCVELVWMPEVDIRGNRPLPLHPAEQIAKAPSLIGKSIITLSEHIILWFLREICEGRMEPHELELYCDGERMDINEDGDFKGWPGGFFRERAALLFGESD